MPDHQAFDAFYAAQYPRARVLARGLVSHGHDADDVVAQAFAKVASRWESLDHPVTYLRRVVVSTARDLLRARKRHHWLVLLAPADLPETAAHDDPPSHLGDLLATLPRRQREVLVLRYADGLTEPETAAALGISVGSVKKHAHRGIEHLRHHLAPDLEGTLS